MGGSFPPERAGASGFPHNLFFFQRIYESAVLEHALHIRQSITVKSPLFTASVSNSNSNDAGENMSIDFIVHEEGDGVGVVVVENLEAGRDSTGWIMLENKTVQFKILDSIPIGHKVALRNFAVGDTVIKYGTDIGKVVAPIRQGEHLHIHNVKTKRW
jgi:(2R)-sulfolactate sulfo-lyase subunit alpha